MLTTPNVARCQASLASTSATATLKCARRPSLTLRTTWRLSLSEWAPSMRISSVRYAIIDRPVAQRPENRLLAWRNQFRDEGPVSFLNEGLSRYSLGDEVLDDISHFDVAIVGDRDAAFHAVPHFADVFLETPHRTDLALEHDHVVAQQANFGIALNDAVGNVTACHSTHFRNTESVAHFGDR